MKRILATLIIIVSLTCNLIAQKSDSKYILEKKINTFDNQEYILIKEPGFPLKIDSPKNEKGENMTYEDIITPFERISLIADSVFNKEEIARLKKYQCCLTFIISTSGKIEFVSFKLYDPNPEIDIDKMEAFGNLLKKEIIFNIKFPGKVEKEGYIPYIIRIYLIIPYDKTRFYKSLR